jgi:hypothetical protein
VLFHIADLFPIDNAAKAAQLKKAAEQQVTLWEVPSGVAAPTFSMILPCRFAYNQISNMTNCQLEFFHPDFIAREEALRIATGVDDSDISTAILRNGRLELGPSGAPTSKARQNKHLEWKDVTTCVPVLVETMAQTGKYSTLAVSAMLRFPQVISSNPVLRGDKNDRINVIYVATMLDHWFHVWKNFKPNSTTCDPLFDISEINMDLWNMLASKERADSLDIATYVVFLSSMIPFNY